MFSTNSKIGFLVTVLVAIGFLYPMTAWAHRFGGPNDPCERRVGASFVHITLYQPQFDPDAEYCDSVPRDGNTVVVVDVLGDDLRRLPIGLELAAMGKSGAPRTILKVAPRVYRRGVADAQVVLGGGLEYVVRVAIQDGDQPRLFTFPIRVAPWYRMLIVPSMLFFALVSLIAISMARYYWSGQGEKPSARLVELDAAGRRSDARAPRAVRGGR